ncbi:MAG: FkbM family methyltransferase [Solirubrobacterales bacterium]|nr:FkbM family methyltransferase [Solirubrobacterales bacterium]
MPEQTERQPSRLDLRAPDTPRTRALRLLERTPPMRSPHVRRMLRTGRDRAVRWRRHAFEACGDDRYSRPGLGDMERKLERRLPARGFFVEAGAHDGFSQSNTYFLERFCGWSGLLVEPVPELYRAAVKERPASQVINCALVSPEEAGHPVRIHHAGLMSIVAGARGDVAADRAYLAAAGALPFAVEQYDVEVPGRTLSELLDELGSPAVDFLSLDLEGYELEALAGLDFARHAPGHILLEAHDEPALAALEAQLGDEYEVADRIPPNDVLYIRRG